MNKRRVDNKSKNRKRMVLATIFSAFFLLSLVGTFGGLGDIVRKFLLGVLGFSAYPIFVIALIISFAKIFGASFTKGKIRIVLFVIALSILLLLWMQVVTTVNNDINVSSYSQYLLSSYDAGMVTAGGLLGSIIAYPFIALMGKYSAILIAVIFFVVLFFAILPSLKVSQSQAREGSVVTKAKKQKGKKTQKTSKQRQMPCGLFVDSVVSGDKNAKTIKMRSQFSREIPSFEPFDVDDVQSFANKGSVLPEPVPEYYSSYANDRSSANIRIVNDKSFGSANISKSQFAIEDANKSEFHNSFDNLDAENASSKENNYFGSVIKRSSNNQRGLFGNKNQQNSYPQEARSYNLSSTINEEPKKTQSKPSEPIMPILTRKKIQNIDIIASVDDLKRANSSIGNTTSRVIDSKSLESNKDNSNNESQVEIKNSSANSTRDIDEITQKTTAPAFYEIEESEPIKHDDTPICENNNARYDGDDFDEGDVEDAPTEDSEESITEPQIEHSSPEVKLEKAFASTSNNAPKNIDNDFDEDMNREDRTRKARSDLGGTHYTQKKAQTLQSGFIAPKMVSQMDVSEVEEAPARPYVAPPINLLPDMPAPQDESDVQNRANLLVQALASFNINSEVIDHKTGPTFTQFAVTLPDNMSVNKITPLEADIKRKLMITKSIRIVPSVPGLDAIGIEIPNKKSTMVGLRSLINSPNFEKDGKLYFAIGVDVSGQAIYGDLLKMPHLLVAGSTGSGKSVCLNVMITSIMYHYSPDVVRFIMVDPKKVELSVYCNMPHMLMPGTVTDAGKAVNALNWAVKEMDHRYDILRDAGCRNIGEYNEMQKKNGGKRMYYIVLIVDEMADLMSRAKREVEDRIQSLTSKARAAGIHLVVATQRPSVDVITGTIKNNIPTRIAFKVTSFADSKTILDRGGAETLFGYGDMLYSSADNGGELVRLQGPYVGEEVSDIVKFIKEHNDCRFDSSAEKIIQADKEENETAAASIGAQGKDSDEDEMFADALLSVINCGQASISKLQRFLRIGYTRAARIIDEMEERGYIGAADAPSKPRAVLITRSEYEELYGDSGIDGVEV